MKKLLNTLIDPQKGLAVAGVFFIIALINSLMVDASSMEDLSWWGKLATGGFMIVFAILFIRYFILPIGYWVVKLFK